jgi:WD40 repeat protein
LGNGKFVLSDKELLLWDPKRPSAPVYRLKVAPAELLSSDTPAQSFAFSPDGRILAIGRSYDRQATDVGDDVKVLLWDTRRRRTMATIRLGSFVYSVAFNPTGTMLAVGLADRVELWRLSDRSRVAVIGGVHGPVEQLAFTADGQKLVAADHDGVQLWSVTPVATFGVPLPGGQGPGIAGNFGYTFALRPDGRSLAVADGGQTAVVWSLTPASWRRDLCRILDRDLTRAERTRFLPASQRSERTCP